MSRGIFILFTSIFFAVSVFATDSKESSFSTIEGNSTQKITIRVGAPKAPPILPVLKMIRDKVLGENVDIKLDFWETPEQLIAMIQSNKNDIYAFPLTVIAKLYNKGFDVKLTDVNTWGVAYFLSSDPKVKTWAHLKGKTIYVPLQSSPPDVMTQYFLKKAGLSKDDYTIIYTTKTELAHLMISGKVKYGTMLEPLVSAVTMKNPNMKVILSFEKEWQRVRNTKKKIPNAGMGVSAKFAKKHHSLVVEFEKEYKKAVTWIHENLDEAGTLAQKELGIKKSIIIKSIPSMGLHYKSAIDSKEELKDFYQLLYDFNPKTVGGRIPDADMYFK